MTLDALYALAARLPFPLDDTAAANDAFRRWQTRVTTGEATDALAADKRTVDLWCYCFIYRYFLLKLATHPNTVPLDHAVACAFRDVQRHLHGVRRPDRFTAWVGTICRNTFVDYLRRRRALLPLDAHALPAPEEPRPMRRHDAALIRDAVCTAIDRLPGYLQPVARLRLLEQRSYEAISRETGHPPPTLRAYVNKSLGLLRRAPRLRLLLHELQS
ncbi:MAG: hypothetical protein R3247_03430 [Rhodothermales bacterium]|nr:hypothetical protein [Rhodothermales bacterium]